MSYIWTYELHMKLPRFHPFLWPKMAILGQKKPRAPVISGAKRLGHASFRNCIADAFGGGAAWPWYPAAGRRALSQLERLTTVEDMGMNISWFQILRFIYSDFKQSWDLKQILNPGSNFHYRMVGLRSTQSCQSGYFIRNLGVGARYFVARGFRSHIMGRLGSSTAFCSDHVVDSDHDQSTKCSCKKSSLDDLRFCGAKSVLQNAPSKNWTLRASYETLFRIPPFL